MLVYGIRCNQADLADLPKDTVADYYIDYGLLVFPSFTKPTCITTRGSRITTDFLHTMRLLVEQRKAVIAMDFEQPYLSDQDATTVKAVQDITGSRVKPDWYHVPRLATTC